MYHNNTKLRYNYNYIDPALKNKTFCLFNYISDSKVALFKIPVSNIGTEGSFEFYITKPYKIKRLIKYKYDTEFTIISNEIVNTSFYTDGIITKTEYLISYDIVDSDFVISIDPLGLEIEFTGKVVI